MKTSICKECGGTGMIDYGLRWDHDDPGYAKCWKCGGTGKASTRD